MRERLRLKHYSLRTKQEYVPCLKRHIHFYGVRHPPEMGKVEIESFLTSMAVERRVSAATQMSANGSASREIPTNTTMGQARATHFQYKYVQGCAAHRWLKPIGWVFG
jgi:hypothetical protein